MDTIEFELYMHDAWLVGENLLEYLQRESILTPDSQFSIVAISEDLWRLASGGRNWSVYLAVSVVLFESLYQFWEYRETSSTRAILKF